MKALDLTGQRFGKLLVERCAGSTITGQRLWICKCDCGGKTTATSSILNSGHKLSCGCASFFDLTGKKFGMLSVIKIYPHRRKGKVLWICHCDCGKETISGSANLRRGVSASCGCVRIKHHGKNTSLYRTWGGMKTRCHNPKTPCWKRYGGRGIKICDEWINDFSAFRAWALVNGYKPGLTIDRKDNDGNYSPDNCQWLTLSENSKKVRMDERIKKTSI
jgi:hypothetical protein